jgi:uncharacterized protein YuzE
MALYTYDEEADALYVLLAPEPDAAIERTLELGERLHVDLDVEGRVVGVEILYPRLGDVDLDPLRAEYGVELRVPFRFAA